ncbi:MAG: DUF1499 domain-containing protein [Pseudomonadales bacterium]|nr:DUF1499 domain-containing protein [Pseudomonadales bacterium]
MNDSISNNPKPWLLWLAILALIAGGAVGLAALSAPAGVWLGLWPFGTGFGILRAINPYTGYIAAGCVLLAVVLVVLAQVWKTGNAPKLAGLAIIGALAAGIAWYIPGKFQPQPGQAPLPIHDVSTDTVNPPDYVAVLPLRAQAPNTTVYGGSPNMTHEKLAQLQAENYPDLVPRILDVSPEQAFDRALAAVETMGWEVVAAVPEAGRIEATDTTFWFRFKDDVVIRIRPEGANQARVDARSLSRVGGSDFGTNAKRLRAFFEVL